jgi:hypothetical protein
MTSQQTTERLQTLQAMLEHLYEVETDADVSQFLLTDETFVKKIEGKNWRPTEEKLLVYEIDNELNVSLYLDPDLLNRLEQAPPEEALTEANLRDFWLALEGVSHFVYLGHNARYERPVSRLEMELQAEVDKFVLANLLLAKQQQGQTAPAGIHRALFHKPRFHEGLHHHERRRYARATHWAGRYCSQLMERMRARRSMHRDLRRFYRLNRHRKFEFIEAAG